MGANWTEEQSLAIHTRKKNLLVSAAAGSGKTAVLVERIIQMITDREHPMDIDHLLVMTFTNAAAAEMRERVGNAIEKLLMETPDDEHLQKQATMVHYAQITTIDSFCLTLIRNHFNQLDLDPAFRIGDEGELTLLRGDVMSEMLEERYASGDEAFGRFIETYAQGKGDAGISELIMQIYHFSQSNPWPGQWLSDCRREVGIQDEKSFETQPWMAFLMKDVHLQLSELCDQIQEVVSICQEDEILQAYEPMLVHDLVLLQEVRDCDNYDTLQQKLEAMVWDRLATIRNKEVNVELKSYVTVCRDRAKKIVSKLQERYCLGGLNQVFGNMEQTAPALEMLLTLAEDFTKRYQEEKREKNIVDFNDLEHEALHVLWREEKGRMVPSQVADDLCQEYEEILVDEYQDSNQVQEALVQALSRERFGQPNVFMVGDVKQSIYKFRLAKPELFMEKYDTYQAEGEQYQKIELHMNFRSRDTVLSSTNDIFYLIMTRALGGIGYDADAALYPGAVFPSCEETAPDFSTELLVSDTSAKEMEGLDEEAADFTARELEAKMIAARILELVGADSKARIWDVKAGDGGAYRKVRFSDIVILLRSTSGWTEPFLSVLMSESIPAYAESRMGYFDTREVETILSLLSVIDNPMQDVPLAAVMKSPFIGLSDTELAMLTATYKKVARTDQNRGLYGAWVYDLSRTDVKTAGEQQITSKLTLLDTMLHEYGWLARTMPLHELLYRIYAGTGYYDFVSAMPAGRTRQANLDMLVEKAAAFEKTSYRGLFHFIRYIENLKKYDSDFGEASVLGEDDDTVRIMSIHKSKGLEFPVVFLAGMGKRFNKQDLTGKILIEPDLGISTDYIDIDTRLKYPTLKKSVLKRKSELDSLGEELRVLYVAMTRAREKLIMTGTDRSLEKKLADYASVPTTNGQIPSTLLMSASSYLDWVLMSMGAGVKSIRLKQVPLATVAGREVKRQIMIRSSRQELEELELSRVYDEESREMFEDIVRYQYPYGEDIRLHTAISVSELKKMGQLADQEERVPYLPAGPKTDHNAGADRGTAYHRVLELLPFDQVSDVQGIAAMVEQMKADRKLLAAQADFIDPAELLTFVNSGIGRRMALATREHRLHKEQQFVLGIPACEMKLGQSKELVLIQGIIDAYLEEEDGLVVVDYKTDRIATGQEQLLVNRYQTQLDYYARALEQMTGKKVNEKILYSLTLQKEIRL